MKEIAAQIKGADDAGSDGWMLWNSHDVCSAEGLGSNGAEQFTGYCFFLTDQKS